MIFQSPYSSLNDFSVTYRNYNDYNEFATKGRLEQTFSADEAIVDVRYIERRTSQENAPTEERIKQIKI